MRTKQKLFIVYFAMEKPLGLGITGFRRRKQTRTKKSTKESSIQLIEREENSNSFELRRNNLAHVLICVVREVAESARMEVSFRVSRRVAEHDGTVVIAQVQPSDLAVDVVLASGACFDYRSTSQKEREVWESLRFMELRLPPLLNWSIIASILPLSLESSSRKRGTWTVW
jgi:hypothetical protein